MLKEGKRKSQGLDQGSYKKFTRRKNSSLSSRKLSNTIKGENKLEGATNYRFWKKMIDIILEKNKVLDLVKGKNEKAYRRIK